MTEPDASTATRGRPRPASTIERDERVYAVITAEGASKKDIVAAVDLPGNEVYLSLYRLQRDGKIKREGSNWKRLDVPAI
jgi:predicted Rossmann fold nucleotide-binding protein DprA/Smf involved in DNA uptake